MAISGVHYSQMGDGAEEFLKRSEPGEGCGNPQNRISVDCELVVVAILGGGNPELDVFRLK